MPSDRTAYFAAYYQRRKADAAFVERNRERSRKYAAAKRASDPGRAERARIRAEKRARAAEERAAIDAYWSNWRERMDKAICRVKSGATFHEAAREFGLNRDSVRHGCTSAGVTLTAEAKYRHYEGQRTARAKAAQNRRARIGLDPLAVAQAAKTNTYAKVATEFGLTRCQVAGYVNRARQGVYDAP